MRSATHLFSAVCRLRTPGVALKFLPALLLLTIISPAVSEDIPLLTDATKLSEQHLTTRDSGRIEKIKFKVGDSVQKGTVILELDMDRQRFSLEAAMLRVKDESAIETAKSEVRARRAELENKKILERRRMASEQEVEQADAMVGVAAGKQSSAEFNLEMAKLELKKAREELEKRLVRSTVDGVVTEIPKTTGEAVGMGTHVATVADQSDLITTLKVLPGMAEAMSLGQKIPLKRPGSNMIQYATIQSITTDANGKNGEKILSLAFEETGMPSDAAGTKYEMVTKPAPVSSRQASAK